MKATIKVNKDATYIFVDEAGNFKIHGETCKVLALYSALGAALKDSLKDNELIEAFNHILSILTTDDPKETLDKELKERKQ